MLTPQYLEHCADGVIELYQQLDESIARDIARRLMKMGEITDTARWQAEQLQHAGLLFEDVVAEVAKYSGATETAVRHAFEDAGVQSVDAEIEQYLRAGITVPPIRQSERAWNILQAALRKTNGELKNLTLTTAVETQQRFIDACALAEMQVSSGMMSYQTAIRNAIGDASRAGASVLYPSGHIDKLDVAVRRAVLTGVNQTCGKISLTLAEEFGCDLMEITAHAGARPEHAVWQGKLVSLSGRRGYLTLSDIGYGTGAGFMGWNCRHSWNPFFEGISERNYTPEQIEKLNARDIEYNGQKYTAYEISQMQRKMEREIRATKRELTAFDAAGLQEDFARRSVKLKAQEQKLKDFTRATDRRIDSARVQVQGFGHSQASKAVWATKQTITKQARFKDEVYIVPPEKGDAITHRSLYNALNKNEIGKETLDYILSGDCRLEVNHTKEAPSGVRGECFGRYIVVYAHNTKTVKLTSSTIVHEVTHEKYKIGHDQWSEAVCFAREHLFQYGELTISDKRAIIKKIKELYPEYPWKKAR